MRKSLALCFIYKTVFGRMILKLLVQPEVSRVAGKFLSSGLSKWLIPFFIRKHKIDMDNIEIPPQGFLWKTYWMIISWLWNFRMEMRLFFV